MRIARETGWTLEYIDKLPLEEIRNFLGVLDAETKIEQANANTR